MNPQDFYRDDGSLIPIPHLPRDVAASLQGFEVITGGDGETVEHLKKIKWSDKKAALDSLARINGMFIDKQEVNMPTLEGLLSEIAASGVSRPQDHIKEKDAG